MKLPMGNKKGAMPQKDRRIHLKRYCLVSGKSCGKFRLWQHLAHQLFNQGILGQARAKAKIRAIGIWNLYTNPATLGVYRVKL